MSLRHEEDAVAKIKRRKSLTFARFSKANAARCEDVFHPLNNWSPSDWACAAAGELGEACNIIKKRRRGDKESSAISTMAIAAELADAVIYIDLLATRLGIDLEKALIGKFNAVSRKRGSEIML